MKIIFISALITIGMMVISYQIGSKVAKRRQADVSRRRTRTELGNDLIAASCFFVGDVNFVIKSLGVNLKETGRLAPEDIRDLIQKKGGNK